ncbi:MAG TPA: deoxyribose-phosphate aldolase [Phycisphaerales bacterium]|nr:deoxyribose-phosphate aldolase [Phycisphaerales bacterium]
MRSPTVDRVMVEERAASFTRRSIKTSAKVSGLRLALSMLDLTTLEGKDSPEKVRSLCRKAIRPDVTDPSLPHVAAVCVYPAMVETAVRELAAFNASSPTRVHVASVATGFPSGQYPLSVRLDDTRRAIEAGADEIDMVISRGLFLAGDRGKVFDEIAATKELCASIPVGNSTTTTTGSANATIGSSSAGGAARAHLKVILETGELETYDHVRQASDLAIAAGLTDGDFIKTSTGKVQPAATMPVTLVMLEAIRDHFLRTGVRIGMKPAGGIRTAKQALHYLVMVKETLGDDWLTPRLFRFGASTLTNDVLMQLAKERTGRYMAAHDFAEA